MADSLPVQSMLFSMIAPLARVVEVDETFELTPDPIGPVGHGVGGVHRPLTDIAGIADQSGRSTGEHDRAVARTLESLQREQGHEVAGMQTRPGRIETGIERDRSGVEIAAQRVEIG